MNNLKITEEPVIIEYYVTWEEAYLLSQEQREIVQRFYDDLLVKINKKFNDDDNIFYVDDNACGFDYLGARFQVFYKNIDVANRLNSKVKNFINKQIKNFNLV